MSSGIGRKRGIAAVDSAPSDSQKLPSTVPSSSSADSLDPWASYLHPLLAAHPHPVTAGGTVQSLSMPAGAASEALSGIIASELADLTAEREERAAFVHERLASQLAYDARMEDALQRIEAAKRQRAAARKQAAAAAAPASGSSPLAASSSSGGVLAASSGSGAASGLHDVDSEAARALRGSEPQLPAEITGADQHAGAGAGAVGGPDGDASRVAFVEVPDGDATAGPGAAALLHPAAAERERLRAAAEGEQEADDASAPPGQVYGGRPIRGYTSGALYVGAERACGVPPLRRSGWRDVMHDGAFPLSAFLHMPGADGVGAAAVSARVAVASARSGGRQGPGTGAGQGQQQGSALPPPASVTAAAALAMAEAARALANGTGPGTARQAAALLRQPAFPDRGFPLPAYARGGRLARRMAMAADADAAAAEEGAHLDAAEAALAALGDRLPVPPSQQRGDRDQPFAPLLEALARRATQPEPVLQARPAEPDAPGAAGAAGAGAAMSEDAAGSGDAASSMLTSAGPGAGPVAGADGTDGAPAGALDVDDL